MEGLRFLLGVIISPPTELSDAELETYYHQSLKPLLSITFRFPDIPLTLYISGPFLEWLELHHTEFITALSEMIRRKQVEVLGGGFYSPLLPLLPPSDRIGQIEELTTTVRRLLGRRPRGGWLHNTVWDSSLVLSLTGCGLEYTFLDEEDFIRLGVASTKIGIPCVTENQGRILTCIPVKTTLAEQIMKGNLGALDLTIRQRFGHDDSLLTVFFSLSSLQEVPFFHEASGFENFLNILRSGYPGMLCVNPSSYLKRTTVMYDRVFFASTDYATLCRNVGISPPAFAERQSWKQFLTDFDDSNRLYSKMVHTHLLVSSLRGDKFKKKAASEELWKGQSLRAYIPDGRLARYCRQKAFQALINAEVLARDKTSFLTSLTSLDFDLDGLKEFLFQGKKFNLFIDPVGGVAFEWDWLERPWNWADADHLTHRSPPKLFVDRFFHDNGETGEFWSKEFRLMDLNREQRLLSLAAVSTLSGPQGTVHVRLKKTFKFDETSVEVFLEIELLSGPEWSGWYELDSYLYCGTAESAFFRFNPEFPGQAQLSDIPRDVHFLWSWKAGDPPLLEIVHHSSSVLAGDYVAHRFAPRWKVNLTVGTTWTTQVTWLLSERSTEESV